jgi:hypothetical protein
MDYLSTETDPSGRFVLAAMPRAPSYEVVASSNRYYGRTRVTRQEQAQVDGIEIRIQALLFERFVCVDESGAPVDNSLLRLKPLEPGRVFVHSTTGSAEPGFVQTLGRLRVNLVMGPGEGACFWCADGARPLRVSIECPGFERVDMSWPGRNVSEWPATQNIVLRRTPLPSHMVIYRFSWPTFVWPEEWGRSVERQPFVVFLKDKRSGLTTILTAGRRALVAERDAAWEVRPIDMATSERSIEYVARDSQGEILVEPNYPEYGFVTLKYVPGTGEGDSYAALFVDGGSFPQPRIVWPGCARIGPLSVGRHTITRQLRSAAGVILQTDTRDIDIREGHVEIDW